MPRTLVFFHAHPDDEAIATGGTMAQASRDGHRVVLVVATRGELGEVADGFLDPGEALADRRVMETHAAAGVLGVHRVEFLGYVDSGMDGRPENDADGSFWRADVEEAAGRLAAILTEEQADILTIYDEWGAYGHPDHVQVHRVGARAAELASTPRVYMSTIDQDRIRRLFAEAKLRGDDLPGDLEPETLKLGVPGERITTRVDVSHLLDVKRQAMAAHASQISETSFFLAMPREQFLASFGVEEYIRVDTVPDHPETSLLEGL